MQIAFTPLLAKIEPPLVQSSVPRAVEEFFYDNKIVRDFGIATVIWGIIGMLVGVIIAFELARPELNQLRQRVLASYHLGPLSIEETRAYIEHRLHAVGWTGDRPRWDDGAFAAIHRRHDGHPAPAAEAQPVAGVPPRRGRLALHGREALPRRSGAAASTRSLRS